MSIVACDDTYERAKEALFLILNSWGPWNGGPKLFEQPDGSFWIYESVMDAMIRQGQTWGLGGIKGFPARKINWSLLDEIL